MSLARQPREPAGLSIAAAGALNGSDVLHALDVSPTAGLAAAEADARRHVWGHNAVSTHRARFLPVLGHQLRSPLLGLLLAAAIASGFVGELSGAVIITAIIGLSIGLGFVNEYRAEKAAEALHDQIRHETVVIRDGRTVRVNVTDLVPGDIVELKLGDIVPADIRLLRADGLECDESVLTGEPLPASKNPAATAQHTALAELSSCALMGTVVHAGSAKGVVVSTAARTEFGAIAAGLSTHQLDTEFQIGLRKFSMLLVYVAGALTTSIFVINVLAAKPVMDALLFSLAIAVGITPQLLPAVVSTSLAAGSRRMSRRKVLVKRLVCIEDLGNISTLLTDKTGTLTVGRIHFMRAVPASGADDPGPVRRWGLLCTDDPGQRKDSATNPLDEALWDSPTTATDRDRLQEYTRVDVLPFDHERRMNSVLLRDRTGRLTQVTKGAPETVLQLCADVPDPARWALAEEFAAGNRVVAVATRTREEDAALSAADERDLHLEGLLVFLDPPKRDAAESLRRLAGLGITVKVVTGDNGAVAEKVCRDLGLPSGATLTGIDLAELDDEMLARAIAGTTVFARVSPEDKARIVRVQRGAGDGVAFLGDGVNDALALHAADVGISVDSGTDVAKDAADVILLEKSLNVLADGVVEGRRIFANTIKYVLMGTSSNFGNMFSAAGASLFLSFLPMLPSQILLNNLLYDSSQLAIPTDNVDEEQLHRPARWDIGFIRRFMLVFGPLSSLFDILTFVVLLKVLNAQPQEFRSGWFVESLATQTLVIFAIRTRRVPFTRSRPSLALALAAIGVVLIGALLPATPLAATLGFAPLPGEFFAVLAAMVVGYLLLIEFGKRIFYRTTSATRTGPRQGDIHVRHVTRRVARFEGREAGKRAVRLAPGGRSRAG